MHRLRSTGERELPSRVVGEEVMQELRKIDGVAYVRFASVYRDFQDVSEFQDEIRRLKAASGNAQRTDEDLAGDGDVGNGS
jgi:transcriptional repressor NrdR